MFSIAFLQNGPYLGERPHILTRACLRFIFADKASVAYYIYIKNIYIYICIIYVFFNIYIYIYICIYGGTDLTPRVSEAWQALRNR